MTVESEQVVKWLNGLAILGFIVTMYASIYETQRLTLFAWGATLVVLLAFFGMANRITGSD